MNERIRKANERKRNLIEKINLAQRHKKEVIDKVNVLDAIYSQKEITFIENFDNCAIKKSKFSNRAICKRNNLIKQIVHKEYEKKTKSIFGERAPKKWIEYYDGYAKSCQSEIENINKDIKKENIKKISYFAIPILFFIFISLLYQFSHFGITGSTVEKFKEIYSENVGKEFVSGDNYGFNVKQDGGLDYLKVSGEIIGEGNVKVYLQGGGKEFLVLDSTDLEFEKVILTGGIITGFGTEGTESSGSSTSSAGTSDTGNVGGSSSGASDSSGAGTVSGNAGGSSQEGTGTTTGTETGTGTEIGAGTETTTLVEGQNAGGGTSNETSAGSSGNASQMGNQSEDQGNGQVVAGGKVKKFSNYCKETCDLTSYNLSADSYNLRIEVNGDAKLKLDSVKYEVESEKKGAVGNLTNATILELNLTNMTEAPTLIKEIPNLEIEVNGSYNLSLSEYFFNAEDYEVDESENITFILTNETLEIIPEKDFEGNRTGKVKARNEFGEIESNEFNISVVGVVSFENVSANVTTLQYKAVINRPTKWLKVLNTSSAGD